jgi:hypothetical protein
MVGLFDLDDLVWLGWLGLAVDIQQSVPFIKK